VVRQLEGKRIEVAVESGPLRPGRLIKQSEEVKYLKAAQRAAVAGVEEGRRIIGGSVIGRDGVLRDTEGKVLTSERVRAAIAHVLLDHGCHADELIVAGGDQAVDPHERGHGPLRAEEWIILDIFPQSESGYWGDITRTVMKGTPTPDQKRLYETVKRAQMAALRQVKAGVKGSTIHEGIVTAFERAGYATGIKDGVPQGFIHSTGHGVGLDIHEAPRIAPGSGRLRAGMVVTIEPGLYYRGLGGVRIEDTVLVTKEGCQLLPRCAKTGTL
jgi:Xaa-Pro aminopeptidase